jgi:hypothetical protein
VSARLLAGLPLALALSQAPAVPLADIRAVPEASVARIQKALSRAPALVVPDTPPRDGLVFRVTVRAPKPEKPMWDDWSNVPSYIRPNMPRYQYDFLQQVTPEQFRAGTLYTVGLPIGPMLELLGKHIHIAQRKSAEARARDEVRKALADLLACRENPAKAGCSPIQN